MSLKMSQRKRKFLYWLLKIVGVIVSCAFPIWAIVERFPLFKSVTPHATAHTIGTGGILIVIVLLVIFRKTIFGHLKERLKGKHAPPITVWVVMLALSYLVLYISKFILDVIGVFWMGLIGCGVGTILTFIAENVFRKDKANE